MITYEPKVYLGDGVFMQRDSLGRERLTTENGYQVTNEICLEPEVLAELIRYAQRDRVEEKQ